MKYFSDHYKGVYALPNELYTQVKQDFRSHFHLKTRHLFVSDVVFIEPQISKDANELARRQPGNGFIEHEPIMITSVEPSQFDNSGNPTAYLYGFVRLNAIPKPFINLIDNLFEENQNLREAVAEHGINPDLAALGITK